MVQEPLRQLTIRRRGTFFEDPFFKDAREDYSNAVRRIVDRFNDGWVSPAGKWPDSQYHSMYRTLRTARLNYSTHSAKFKDEENCFKLVMDVKEFVGGDITVRTAGSTVSVRGKMEQNAENFRDRSQDRYPIAGRFSAAKTLHRRFTLPDNADCDKVESSLSKDAILSVTIPKRVNVHYIPVKMDNGVNKENEDACDDPRMPGVKRPSESPRVHRRKKSQDEPVTRRLQGEQENATNDERYRSRTRDSEGKRRRKFFDTNKKEDESSAERISRRMEDKYEKTQEIFIPIRMEHEDKVFLPEGQRNSSHLNSTVAAEDKSSTRDFSSQEDESKFSKYAPRRRSSSKDSSIKISEYNLRDVSPTKNSHSNKNSSYQPTISTPLPIHEHQKTKDEIKNCSTTRDNDSEDSDEQKKSRFKLQSEWKTRQLNKLNYITKDRPLMSYADSLSSNDDQLCSNGKNEPNKSRKNSNVIENELKQDDNFSQKNVDQVICDKEDKLPRFLRYKKSYLSTDEKSIDDQNKISQDASSQRNLTSDRNYLSSDLTSSKFNENDKVTTSVRNTYYDDSDELQDIIINENDSLVSDSLHTEQNGLGSSINPDSLKSPNPHFLTPKTIGTKSPCLTPGGRNVPVHKRQSLMEEDMFKDCWSDFSNTLQDVLSRLQELSSELGNSKLLSTSTDSSNPKETDETNPINETQTLPSKDSKGGVGWIEGGTKDGTHVQQNRGQGCDLNFEITQKEALKRPRHMPFTEDRVSSGDSVRAKVPRPISLNIDTVASEPVKRDFVLRPSSLILENDVSRSLLREIDGNCIDAPEPENTRPLLSKERSSLFNGREADRVGGALGRSTVAELSQVDGQSSQAPGLARYSSRRSRKLPSKLNLGFHSYSNSGEGVVTSSDSNEASLNDLSIKKEQSSDESSECRLNIHASPESNVSDESDSELSSSVRSSHRSLKEKFQSKVSPEEDKVSLSNSNTSSEDDDAINLSAKQTNDAMGCERHLTPNSRSPFKETLFRHPHKTRETQPLQETKCHGIDTMGSLLSRGNKNSPTVSQSSTPTSRTVPSSPRKSAFRTVKSQTPVEEKPLPSYVKPKSDNYRKASGFAHINSDNVRRMRDVWSVRQDNKLPPVSSPKVQRVPVCSSPSGVNSRRSSEFSNFSRRQDFDSPRQSPSQTPTERNRSSPFRRASPSPVRSAGSPIHFVFPDAVSSSTDSKRSSSVGTKQQPTSPPFSSSRLLSRGRNSPSPCNSPTVNRKSTQGMRDFSARGSPTSTKTPSTSTRSPSTPTKAPSTPTRTHQTSTRTSSASNRASSDKRSSAEGSGRRRTTDSPKLTRNSPPSPAATKAHHKIFKRLRDANLQPDSEAICFKEETDKYTMVLDVEEFVPGEVEVLQDDRVLTVKGQVETKDRGGHTAVKTFSRTFNIPKNSREQDIDSALSKDGILTIFVPKKKERVIKIQLVD